jgi:hypothetical protein
MMLQPWQAVDFLSPWWPGLPSCMILELTVLPTRFSTKECYHLWPWKTAGFLLSRWWSSIPSCMVLELMVVLPTLLTKIPSTSINRRYCNSRWKGNMLVSAHLYSMCSALDLWIPKMMGIFFIPWITFYLWYCDPKWKGNTLRAPKPICYTCINFQCSWPLDPRSIGIIFISSVVHICVYGGKNNILEPGNHFAVLSPTTLDFGPLLEKD